MRKGTPTHKTRWSLRGKPGWALPGKKRLDLMRSKETIETLNEPFGRSAAARAATYHERRKVSREGKPRLAALHSCRPEKQNTQRADRRSEAHLFPHAPSPVCPRLRGDFLTRQAP